MILMDIKRTNLMLYIILAVIVAVVAAAAVVLVAFTGSYSLNVALNASSKGTIYPYQTSKFVITVVNTGSSQISNLVVGLYANGTELQHYTVTVPGHKEIALRYNYTYTDGGLFYFQAVADPGSLLNIANRSSAQSGILLNVSRPEIPDVYKSVPNSGISETQSFTMSGTGMYSTEALAQAYELTALDNMFGTSKSVMTKLFGNLYGFVADAYGTDIKYSNGTSAYVLWLQGTLGPSYVEYILSTFRVPQSNAIMNGTMVGIARMDNRTSICTSYSNGWTKLLEYYNNTRNTTCLSMMGRSYAPNESAALVSAINNSRELTHYQSGFIYNGSQGLGSFLYYSNHSIGASNLFQNKYGLFISYLQRTGHVINASRALTCAGIIYNRNGTHVCSYIVPPSNRENAQTFGLVNSTEFAGNYSIMLYSLVNNTELMAAHQNAASLIYALKVNQTAANWVQARNNTCLLYNSTDMQCGINSFDYLDNIANVSITNRLDSPIRISYIACRAPDIKIGYSANYTIGSGSSNAVTFPCYDIPVPVQTLSTSYVLSINYTYGNAKRNVSGLLNISTGGFS